MDAMSCLRRAELNPKEARKLDELVRYVRAQRLFVFERIRTLVICRSCTDFW